MILDMENITTSLDLNFSLSHIGTLNSSRNPVSLWKVLSELSQGNENLRKNLKIQLIGKVDFSVLEDLEKYGLTGNLVKIDYLSHDEAIKNNNRLRFCYFLINTSQNAKVFSPENSSSI